MLPSSGHLDRETVRLVLESGHSRIPVYAGERTNIVGLFLTKELLAYPVSQRTPISELRLRSLPRCGAGGGARGQVGGAHGWVPRRMRSPLPLAQADLADGDRWGRRPAPYTLTLHAVLQACPATG